MSIKHFQKHSKNPNPQNVNIGVIEHEYMVISTQLVFHEHLLCIITKSTTVI